MKGAFRTGWQPDYPFAENYLWQLYSTAAADGNGSNDGDYKNPAFDDLCKQAAAASSTDDANKLYQQAEEILLNDLPAIPLLLQRLRCGFPQREVRLRLRLAEPPDLHRDVQEVSLTH